MYRLAVMIAAVAACGGKRGPDCKTQVADLMTYLRALDHSMSMVYLPDDVHLVTRTDLPPPELDEAPVVIVKASGIVYQGKPIADAVALSAKLHDEASAIQIAITNGRVPHDFKWSHRVWIAADADAGWGTVTAVAAAAAGEGFDHASLLFAKPSKVSAPPASAMHGRLDGIIRAEGGNKATGLADVLREVIGSCKDLPPVFGGVGASEGGDKVEQLLAGFGPAIEACDCNLDMSAFRESIYYTITNAHPMTALDLVLAHDGQSIELPATTPWRDAAAKLTAKGTTWLVAR